MPVGPAIQDRAGFSAFVERYREQLVAVASRIASDCGEAEDVVQDTLIALWQRWQVRPPDDPSAYAFRAVTLNAVKRRMRRRTVVSLDAASERVDADATSHQASASSREDHSLEPAELERAIAQLPVAQQAVLRMRFYLGLSLAQIERNLSISSDTAASRCRYALATLRKTFSGRRPIAGPGKDLNRGKETRNTR